MNYSRQREVILKFLKSVDTHPTAEVVYNNVRIDNPNISLGTVYRNLDILSKNGDILRLKFANEKDRFDGNVDKHYHGICRSCSKLEDIFTKYFDYIDKEAQKNTDTKILSHDIIFDIICSNCKN